MKRFTSVDISTLASQFRLPGCGERIRVIISVPRRQPRHSVTDVVKIVTNPAAIMFEEGSSTVTATLATQAAFVVILITNLGLLLGGQSSDSFAVYWAAPSVGLDGVTFQYGMWKGISKLWEEGIYGIAWLLIICSGVWPIIKLALLLVAGLLPSHHLNATHRHQLLYTLCTLGRFSFIDVWVVVLVVLTIRVDTQSLPGLDVELWIQAAAKGGVVLFLFAVLLTQTISNALITVHNHKELLTPAIAESSSQQLPCRDDEEDFGGSSAHDFTVLSGGADGDEGHGDGSGQEAQLRSLRVFLAHDVRMHAQAPIVQIVLVILCVSALVALAVPCVRVTYSAGEEQQFFSQDYSAVSIFFTICFNRHPSTLVGNPTPGTLAFFGFVLVVLLPALQVLLVALVWFARLSMVAHRRLHLALDNVSHFASLDCFTLALTIVSLEIDSLLDRGQLADYVRIRCAALPSLLFVALAAFGLTALVRFITLQHKRFIVYFAAPLHHAPRPLILEDQEIN